ncbi:MAG: hypothetical protein WCJ95_22130, partial [Mariniphaga sp.]
MPGAISTPIFWITVLIFLVSLIKVYPQATLCTTFQFASGSEVLSTKMKDSLDQLCKKTLNTKRGHIAIKVWQKDDAGPMQKTSLAESRIRNVFAYLITKNCGYFVSESRINPRQTDSVIRNDIAAHENQIEFCILESFPDASGNDTLPERIRNIIPGLLVRERDTIIRGANGTLIKFPSESFKPWKLSDFRYEIDEMFTVEAIGNHNMSTMTTAGGLIT